MEKATPAKGSKKLKIALIASLTLNVLIIGLICFVTWAQSLFTLDYRISNFQYEMCELNYDKNMADIERRYVGDQERIDGYKNYYAIRLCFKNYKTGESLDPKPLQDQIDNTKKSND